MRTDNGPIDLTWIDPERIAAFALWSLHDLAALERARIRAIVSLTEQFPDQLVTGGGRFRTLHVPVVDMTAPNSAQIGDFVEFVDEALADGLAVGVHCLAGLGRTGTMIACYFVSEGMEPDEAIVRVRMARPGSIQTVGQERAVHGWARKVSGDEVTGNASDPGS